MIRTRARASKPDRVIPRDGSAGGLRCVAADRPRRALSCVVASTTVFLVVVLAIVVPDRASAAIFVVPAFGGQDISLDTTSDEGSGAWTAPGVISLVEQAKDDFAVGQSGVTLVLKAPAGFEFNAGQGSVATLGLTDLSALGISVVSSAITVTFTTAATAVRNDNLQISNVEVRPTNQAPTSGQIYRPTTGGGTATIAGLTTTDAADGAPEVATSFGTLSSVGGAPTGALVVQALDTANADATGSAITTVTAGGAFAVRVIARDQFLNDATVDGTASLAFSSPAASSPNGTPPTIPATLSPTFGAPTFTSGRTEVAGFTLTNAAGNQTITVAVEDAGATSLSNGQSGTTADLTVNPAAVAAVAITTQPTGATAGEELGTQPVLSAVDAFGNPSSTAVTSTQMVATVTGGAALFGTATVDIVAGVATFTDLEIRVAGSQSLTFTAGAANVVSDAFTITPAAPDHLVVQPLAGAAPTTTLTAGTAFSVRVTSRDAFNNVTTQVTGGSVELAFSSDAGNAPAPNLTAPTIPTPQAPTFTDGVGTATGFTLTLAESGPTITATVQDAGGDHLAAPANGVTGTSAALTINGGAVATLAVTTEPAGATAGAPFLTQPVVAARDQYNNVTSTAVTGTQVTASVTGGAALTGTATVDIAGSGSATFANLRIDTAGSQSLTFTATAGAVTVQSGAFTVSPATPVSFLVQPLTNNLDDSTGAVAIAVVAGVDFAVRVTARDAFANVATQVTGGTRRLFFQTTAIVAPDGVSLPMLPSVVAPSTVDALFAAGVAEIINFRLTNATAAQTITATVPVGGGGTLTLPDVGVTGESLGFPTNAAPLNHFLVEAQGGGAIGTVTAGTPFNIRVTARDQFHNTLSSGTNDFDGVGQTVVVSSNVAGSAGLGTSATFTHGVLASHAVTFTGVNSGGVTITVTDSASGLGTGAEAGTSATFTVQPGALGNFLVEAQGGGAIGTHAAGASFSIRVTARDANNNTLSFGANVFDGAGATAVISSNVTGSAGLTTTAAFTTGVLASHAVTLTGAGNGTVTLTATDAPGGPGTGAESGTSAAFTVQPAALDHFLVEAPGGGAIGTATVGTALAIRITARDQFDNALSFGPNNFDGGGATVEVASNVAASAGLGTSGAFTNGVLNHAVTFTGVNNGGATVTVTDSAGAPGTGAESGTSSAFTVQPGALDHFLVEAQGGGAIGTVDAGTPFTIRVTARDANGNTLSFGANDFTGAVNTVAVTSDTPGSAGLATSAAFTNGVLASHAVTLTALTGAATITATDSPGGLGTGVESGTSAAFVVAASSDANLSDLTISPGTLSPSFAAGTTSYTAAVESGTATVSVIATRAQVNASLTISGIPATSGVATAVPLAVGANAITVVVTAQNGTTKTYTVTITRAAPAETGPTEMAPPPAETPTPTPTPSATPAAGGVQPTVTVVDRVAAPASTTAPTSLTSGAPRGTLTLTVPPAALPASSELAIGAIVPLTPLVAQAPPPSGVEIVIAYELTATAADGTPITGAFARPATLDFTVNAIAIPAGATPDEFVIAYWDGRAWVELLTAVRANANGTLSLSATTTRVAVSAVFRTPSRGRFDRATEGTGVNAAVWLGGTFAQMFARVPTATSVWVFVDGRPYGYLVGAPAFANAAFTALYPTGVVPAGTIVLVVRP